MSTSELYSRARVLQERIGDSDTEKSFNAVLALLVKNGEHPVTIGEALGVNEREVRNRVTLDEPGLVHCEPSDFRYTADYIGETLNGQLGSQNLAAAPILRLKHLLYKMADEYEASTAAQQAMVKRKEQENARRN